MKFKEIHGKKTEELGALEDKLRKELSGVRMESRMGALKDTTKIGELRRNIARVMTSRKIRIVQSS